MKSLSLDPLSSWQRFSWMIVLSPIANLFSATRDIHCGSNTCIYVLSRRYDVVFMCMPSQTPLHWLNIQYNMCKLNMYATPVAVAYFKLLTTEIFTMKPVPPHVERWILLRQELQRIVKEAHEGASSLWQRWFVSGSLVLPYIVLQIRVIRTCICLHNPCIYIIYACACVLFIIKNDWSRPSKWDDVLVS